MAKVIGEDPSVLTQVTCRHCAAIIQYAQHEVKEYHGKDYSGGSDGKEWVDCPRCGHEAVIRSW